jgi:hypothetical protein
MAPETFQGVAPNIQGDLYSVGAVMYFMTFYDPSLYEVTLPDMIDQAPRWRLLFGYGGVRNGCHEDGQPGTVPEVKLSFQVTEPEYHADNKPNECQSARPHEETADCRSEYGR